MSKGWNYKSGDWLLLCDVCAKKIKASESKERWDGLRVCKDDWEPRHSMDFLRVRSDKISVPFIRPQPEDVFLYGDWLCLESYVPLQEDLDFVLTTEDNHPITMES